MTKAALLTAGCDGDLGDRLVREGRWTRLAPAVYLTGTEPPTDGQLVAAARAHAGKGAVVTGAVACRALGLVDVPHERVVDVLVRSGRPSSTPFVRVQQSTRPVDTWRRGAVDHAMPARAVVDAARRTADLRSARALVLGAVCARQCSPVDLAAEVASGPRRGSGLVRRAVDDALAGAWSAPEAEAAELLAPVVLARRLPPFLLNPTLLLHGQRVGQPDGWLVGTGVGWQVDSRRHHAGDDDFDHTLEVHDDFARYGLVLLHVTPRRLRARGPAWTERLVDAVRSRTGALEPPGLVVQPLGPLQDGRRRRPLPPPR